MANDVAGIAVHLTARVQAAARPGEVLTSGTVDLVVGSGLEFEERGRHVLKGVPGEWFSMRSRETRSARARQQPSASAASTPDPGGDPI